MCVQYPQKSEDGIKTLVARVTDTFFVCLVFVFSGQGFSGVTDTFESPSGFWEQNLNPRPQHSSLTIELCRPGWP